MHFNRPALIGSTARPHHWRALHVGLALSAALATSLAGAAISFTDVSGAAKLNLRGESYGASWGDLNRSG